MDYTFNNCTSLTDLSGYVLPGSVKYLKNTFRGCTSLTKAPVITECTQSEKHQYLENTFYGCTSLTTIPTLPKTVGTIKGAFYGCTSLTGIITFNLGHPYLTSASYYTDCFAGVDFEAQNLSLDGTSAHIDGIGATGTNYCAECNGCCKGGH